MSGKGVPTVKNGKLLAEGVPPHAGVGPIRAESVGPNPNRAQRRALARRRR